MPPIYCYAAGRKSASIPHFSAIRRLSFWPESTTCFRCQLIQFNAGYVSAHQCTAEAYLQACRNTIGHAVTTYFLWIISMIISEDIAAISIRLLTYREMPFSLPIDFRGIGAWWFQERYVGAFELRFRGSGEKTSSIITRDDYRDMRRFLRHQSFHARLYFFTRFRASDWRIFLAIIRVSFAIDCLLSFHTIMLSRFVLFLYLPTLTFRIERFILLPVRNYATIADYYARWKHQSSTSIAKES